MFGMFFLDVREGGRGRRGAFWKKLWKENKEENWKMEKYVWAIVLKEGRKEGYAEESLEGGK
jgi:hypothetical protein